MIWLECTGKRIYYNIKSSHGYTICEVIFLNHQEYSHINYLALDLLIDAKIDRLPVDVAEIASNHGISSIIDFSKSRYDNAVIVSKHILGKYGYNNNLYYSEYLATKILSPLIIFKELGINNFEHFHFLSDLPILIASLRFDLYKNLISKSEIGKYSIEKRALNCFRDWINSQ